MARARPMTDAFRWGGEREPVPVLARPGEKTRFYLAGQPAYDLDDLIGLDGILWDGEDRDHRDHPFMSWDEVRWAKVHLSSSEYADYCTSKAQMFAAAAERNLIDGMTAYG